MGWEDSVAALKSQLTHPQNKVLQPLREVIVYTPFFIVCLLILFTVICCGIGYLIRYWAAHVQNTVLAGVMALTLLAGMYLLASLEVVPYIFENMGNLHTIPGCSPYDYKPIRCADEQNAASERLNQVTRWLLVPPPLRPDCETVSQEMCDLERRETAYPIKLIVAAIPAIVSGLLAWFGTWSQGEKAKRKNQE